jgi:O-antigen ligase
MTLLLGFVALCVGWLVPGHFVPWVSFQQEWTVAAGAALIGFAAVDRHRALQPWPRIAVFAILVACIPLVQLAAGQIRFLSDGVLAALYLCGFALAAVAGNSLVLQRREDFLAGFFGACLAAGIVSVGMAATQWLDIGPVSYVDGMVRGGRPYANLAQPNHLASLLALALVGLLWMFEYRRVGPAVAWLAAFWLATGIVMTQSRTGWLFMLAIAGSAVWVRRRAATRIGVVAIIAGVAMFFVLVALWAPLNELLLNASLPLNERLQPGTRLVNWRLLAGAAHDAPWLGYGWTQVARAVQAAAISSPFPEAMIFNGHNLVLDLVLWNGLPLGIFIAAALTWWLLRHYRECRSADHWLLLLGISALVLHAMLEYPLEYAYFLLPLGFMVGAAEGVTGAPKTTNVPPSVYVVLLVTATALLAWTGVEYMKVEESARQVRFLMMGIGIDKVRTAPPPDVHLLTAPRDFHRFWITPAKPGMSSSDLDWMRRVSQRYPVPPAMLRYALAAGLNGRPQEAADTLVQICFMHTASRCREGLASWTELQKQYPVLRAVPFPEHALKVLGIAH